MPALAAEVVVPTVVELVGSRSGVSLGRRVRLESTGANCNRSEIHRVLHCCHSGSLDSSKRSARIRFSCTAPVRGESWLSYRNHTRVIISVMGLERRNRGLVE